MRHLSRLAASLVALAMVVALPALPASAAASTAGDSVPNFTESGECGPVGVRGPLSPGHYLGGRIYGPYAEFFGRDLSQVSQSMTYWSEPSGWTFLVHTRALSAFQDAYTNIVASGAGYNVTSGAAFVWRNVAGTHRMSRHAAGIALDINPAQNPYTESTLITNMPASYVQAWRDAGFCWGGDWRFSKDPMHYSWRGPAAYGGVFPRMAPYAPLTAPAGFTTKALDVPAAVPSGAQLYAMADRRGDGADDLYALVDTGAGHQIQVAGAAADFGVVGMRRDVVDPGTSPLLADADGDGNADLWVFNDSGTVSADIYFDVDRFGEVGKSVTSAATWSSDAELGLVALDGDDWLPDLYVFRRDTGTVEVYGSTSGYQNLILSSTLSVPVGSDQILLADWDVDGFPDIWLVGSGSPAQIRVIPYSASSGYSGPAQTISSGMPVPSGASVLPGDYDGDGRIDLYVVAGGRISVWLGGVPDRPLSDLDVWFTPEGPNTFDAGPVCSGVCNTVGYVEGSGRWRLAYEPAWDPVETTFYYGDPGDVPFMGDWDCDGVDTPGLYRSSDGYVYLRNSNTEGVADVSFFFGNPGDIPLVGDFNGDGCDTVSLYRPSEGRFYIINRLGANDGGLGAADFSFLFGDPGDKPFAGDFDGDGDDEVGLHRESTGRVYLRFSLTTGVADLDFIYGNPGDVIFAGDWNGDGVDTVAVYRPSDGNWYIRLSNSQGVADHVIPFGNHHGVALPVVGKTGLD